MNEADLAQEFALMRPLWLLALLGLLPIVWLARNAGRLNAWRRFIDPQKLRHLMVESAGERSFMRWMLPVAWVIGCIALAGPSWERAPTPLSQNRDALVILMDLSPSMRGTDIKPDRATRARLKLIDLLRLREDGETALIAYAADAHRVAPLTDDTANIEALAPTLDPTIMPIPGSNVEAAVRLALELFDGAALARGDIVVLTDGMEASEARAVRDLIEPGFRLSVMGIGTLGGAPIPGVEGGFLRDDQGAIVVSKLDRSTLRNLAAATGGAYVELTDNDSDLLTLMQSPSLEGNEQFEQRDTTFDTRQDGGFWFALLLLPLGLLAFRRGVLFTALLTASLWVAAPVPKAQAFSWDDLWKRADQQSVEALERGDHDAAIEGFSDPAWKGVARYRNGEYPEAAENFGRQTTPAQRYNEANATALSGRLEDAVRQYDEIITSHPEMEDAIHNRDVVKKLLEQQQQQQQQQQKSEQQEEQKESEENQSQQGESSPEDEKKESETPPGEEPPEDPGEELEQAEPKQAEATDESDDLSDLSEQWLRNISQDPGGFMRRKFRFEARSREAAGDSASNAARKRY